MLLMQMMTTTGSDDMMMVGIDSSFWRQLQRTTYLTLPPSPHLTSPHLTSPRLTSRRITAHRILFGLLCDGCFDLIQTELSLIRLVWLVETFAWVERQRRQREASIPSRCSYS